MDLRERLRRLAGTAGAEHARPAAPGPPPLLPPPSTSSGLGIRRIAYRLDHRHGTRALGEVAKVRPGALAALEGPASAALAALPPGGFAGARFFDVETTSIGGGAGVYVFLLGVGGIEGDAFVVEQLLLESPAAERALLAAAAERLRAASVLVSFAGRGFDERRLADRFAMAALASPFREGPPHLDLLPLARAVFGGRLASARLRDLEAGPLALGPERAGDLPGALCPDAYFRYLRGDPGAPMEAVLRHNRLDVLSLATLAVEVEDRARKSRDPAELLGLGRRYARLGREDLALPALARAEDEARAGSLPAPEARLLAEELGRLLKRRGRLDEALARFSAAASGPLPSIAALVELAKDAEHRARDWAAAEAYTLAALALARRGRAGRLVADLERRIARVRARKGRAGGEGWLLRG